MLNRKIQKTIREYLTSDSNKILVIDGARQIGKSYIIRHEGRSLFPNFFELNMVEDKKASCPRISWQNFLHYQELTGGT